MITLTPEESALLLTCRPFINDEEADRLRRIAAGLQDWAFLLWRAEQYRMLPLLRWHLREVGAWDRVPPAIQVYIERWVELSRRRSIEQIRQLARISRAMADADIDCFLLKGSGLALLYYDDPLLRPMQDLDLMVRRRDIRRAQRLMFALGYRHGIWDSDSATFTPTIVELTARQIARDVEIPPFTYFVERRSPLTRGQVPSQWLRQHIKCGITDDGTLVMPVFVDLHLNLSEDVAAEDVWLGYEKHLVANVPVLVQSPTVMLWFIAARVYLEAFTYNTLKLSMLGDVHTLLVKAGDRIDWAELLAWSWKYRTRPALYYVLTQVRKLMSADVPLEVLAILRPDSRDIPLDNDYGDLLPKLLSRPALHDIEYSS